MHETKTNTFPRSYFRHPLFFVFKEMCKWKINFIRLLHATNLYLYKKRTMKRISAHFQLISP